MKKIYLLLCLIILALGTELSAQPNAPMVKNQELEEGLNAILSLRKRNQQQSSLVRYRAIARFDKSMDWPEVVYRDFLHKQATDCNLRFVFNLEKEQDRLLSDTILCTLGDTIIFPFQDSLDWTLEDLSLIAYDAEWVYERVAGKKLIDSYYQSVKQLREIRTDLNALTFDDADLLLQEQKELQALRQALRAIKDLKLAENLPLDQVDPKNYLQSERNITKLLRKKKDLLDLAKDNWHVLYFQKAMASGDLQLRKRLLFKALNKASERNIPFAEPHFALAEMEMYAGAYVEAVNRLEMALASKPSFELAEQCRYFARDIYSRVLDHAAANIGQFAIDWYYVALELCWKPIIGADCNAAKRQLMLVRTGMFEYLIDERSYQALADAQQYLGMYREEILYPEKLNIALQRRYQMDLIAVQDLTRNRQLKSALDGLQQLKRREMEFGLAIQDMQALQNTYQLLFDQSIAQAEEARQAKAFDQALQHLAFSEQVLQQSAGINLDSYLMQQQYQKVYTGIFDQGIDKVNDEVNNGNFVAAERSLAELSSFRDRKQDYLRAHWDFSLEKTYTRLYVASYDKALASFNTLLSLGQYAAAFEDFVELDAFRKDHEQFLNQRPASQLQSSFDRLLPLYLADLDARQEQATDYLNRLKLVEELRSYCINGSVAEQDLRKRISALVDGQLDYRLQNLMADLRSKDVNNCTPEMLEDWDKELDEIKSFAAAYTHVWTAGQEQNISMAEDFYFRANCSNQSATFAALMNSMQQYLDNANYVEAYALMEEAAEFAAQQRQCAIPVDQLLANQQKYQHAFDYQLKQQEAELAFSRGDFDKGRILYQEAEALNEQRAVSDFDLVHIALKDYIWDVDNRALQVFYLKYLVDENQDRELINAFMEQIYSWGNKKQYYKELGIALGRLEKGRFDTYKTGLWQYNESKSKAFKGFKSGYKKGFKA